MKKAYCLVCINGDYFYFPYPEVKDFTIYEIADDDVVYFTDEELRLATLELEEECV